MYNLLRLLDRFRGMLMFLFLEVICLYLIVNFNERHNQTYLNSVNAAVGYLYNVNSDFKRYFNLDEQNEHLLKDNQQLLIENEKLREQLTQRETSFLDSLVKDLPPSDTTLGDFDFIGARVINNSITLTNNRLTLNKGRQDGVVEHAGVINGRGIVGVVREVSANYASVMSILHRQTRISAAVKDRQYFGTLVWDTRSPNIMQLEAVPRHAEIARGDTIITSGYSHLFPSDIIIGKIEALKLEEGNNFYQIDVRLVNDMSSLEYAYICIHRRQDQLLTLEREGSNE